VKRNVKFLPRQSAGITASSRGDWSERKVEVASPALLSRRFSGRLSRPDPARREKELDQDCAGQGLVRLLRFYGPTETYFDKTWSLPDIEKVK
jgi:hypothetical protein